MTKDTVEIIFSAMRNTLFLGTNIDDVGGLFDLGVVEHGIFSRKISNYQNVEKFIYKPNNGKPFKTISELFYDIKDLAYEMAKGKKFVWTFRPYPWLDDFRCLGLTPLAWDYYKYLAWSARLHQERLLYEFGSVELKDHIRIKHDELSRKYIVSSCIPQINEEFIISKQFSTSGSGVYFDKSMIKSTDDDKSFLLRVERKVWPHIPICQIGLTSSKEFILYPPSIMIIDVEQGHFDYRGTDFNISRHLSENVIKSISKISAEIAKALASNGFSGIFNCDYLYNPESQKVYLAELNPRVSGCTFILDKKFAKNYLDGCKEAIFMQPSFLSYCIKLFGKIPNSVKKMCNEDGVLSFCFDSKDPSSFISHFNKSALETKPETSTEWRGYSQDDNLANYVFTKSIIKSPVVPTVLLDFAE